MDYSPRDTLDRLAASNRTQRLYPGSFVPVIRRASSDTRLEVLQHQDFVRRLERKYEIEVEPWKKERRHIDQSVDGCSEDNLDVQSVPSEDEETLNVNTSSESSDTLLY